VPARAWGFKSPLGHHLPTEVLNVTFLPSSLCPITLGHYALTLHHREGDPLARRLGVLLLLCLATFSMGTGALFADEHVAITGTMNGPDGEPLAGISFTITGPEDFSQRVETNAEGIWRVPITETGQYLVEIDPDSLPEDVTLTNPKQTIKSVIVFNLERQAPSISFGTGVPAETTPRLEQALQLTADGLVLGLTIALAAVGLSLIFGTTGLTNFAHGELLTLGALSTVMFNQWFGLHLIPSVMIALVISALFGGWVQNRYLWRPLRRRGSGLIAMLVVSIGLGLTARYVFLYIFGGRTFQYAQYAGQSGLTFGPVSITPKALIASVIAIFLLGMTSFWLLRTRNGKASRAIADNPALASASGIEVERVISFVWMGGALLAGFAGVMMGMNQGISWVMGQETLLLIFAAVTLGGLGTAFGAVVGSLVVGLFIQLSTLFIPTELKYVGALLVLILVLLVRPQGILGRRERVG
jgi:neutral amino acid transport system permease protein